MNTTGSISKDLAAQKAKIEAELKAYWIGVPMAYRCMYRVVAACVGLVVLASVAGALWLCWLAGNLAYFSQFAQAQSASLRIPISICAAVLLFVFFNEVHGVIMRFVEKSLDRLAEKIRTAAIHRK